MPSRPTRITQTEWDSRKDAILALRRSKVSLKGIIATMQRGGFTASHAQYESQFRKWEERQNLSADEWRLILQVVDQYANEGKRCGVYKDQQLITPFTLKKKRNQCKEQKHTERRGVWTSSDGLPKCIEIRILGIANENKNISTSLVSNFAMTRNEPTSLVSDLVMTTNEPTSVATSSLLRPVGDLDIDDSYSGTQVQRSNQWSHTHGTSMTDLATSLEGPYGYASSTLEPKEGSQAAALSFDMDPVVPANQPLVLYTAQEVARDASLSPDFLAFLNPSALASPLAAGISFPGTVPANRFGTPAGTVFGWDFDEEQISSIPFEDHQKLQGSLSLNSQPDFTAHRTSLNNQSQSLGFDLTEEASNGSIRQVYTHTLSLLHLSGSSNRGDAILRTGMITSSLSSLLPSEFYPHTSLLESRTSAQKQVFGSTFDRLLIFSIENNFAGLDDVSIGAVLKFLQQDPQMRSRLLRYLQMTPRNVSKVLVEKFIRAAIENYDAPAVTEYLETALVNPNEIVCSVGGRRCTAVERSVMLGSIEVLDALLLAGADIKRALELAVKFTSRDKGRDEGIDTHLVKRLLDHGAEVDVKIFQIAVDGKDTDLINMLLLKISPIDHFTFFQDPGIIPNLARRVDGEAATKIIIHLFESCSQMSCGSCAQSNPGVLCDALGYAARSGNSKLVAFLLNYTIADGRSLIGAIKSRRKDIIELLLERVANIDVPACQFIIRKDIPTTPLAEAVRAGREELIHELERRGALSQITEESRFRAAIYAASEVGNLTYVRRLLQMAPHMNGDLLTLALSASIKEAHEEVALTLLEAGAEVNDRQLSISATCPGPPLREALLQENTTLVYKIMECDVVFHDSLASSQLGVVEAAVQWGNLSVIQDLIQMRALSSYELRATAFAAAVEIRNKPLIEFLIKNCGAELDISGIGRSPLAIAVSNNDIDMLQHLLDLGVEPACSKAFELAIKKEVAIDGDGVLAVLFRAFRAKYPSGKKGFGSMALDIALEQEKFQMLGMLLEAKFDIKTHFLIYGNDTTSALGVAIKKFGGLRLDIIRCFLSAGGDPNGVTSTVSGNVDPINAKWRKEKEKSQNYESRSVSYGQKTLWSKQTALLDAISTKSKALVELLIDAGADFNTAARLGFKRTPLQYACEVGAIEIVELLLQKEVDVNEAPALRGGGTSLQLSAIGGYCRIAEKLLSHGADIHAAPSKLNGRTALEGAAEHGRLHMLLLLWDAAGCKRFSPDQCSRAMSLAEANGHIACCDLLLELSSAGQGFVMSEPFDRWTSFGQQG